MATWTDRLMHFLRRITSIKSEMQSMVGNVLHAVRITIALFSRVKLLSANIVVVFFRHIKELATKDTIQALHHHRHKDQHRTALQPIADGVGHQWYLFHNTIDGTAIIAGDMYNQVRIPRFKVDHIIGILNYTKPTL